MYFLLNFSRKAVSPYYYYYCYYNGIRTSELEAVYLNALYTIAASLLAYTKPPPRPLPPPSTKQSEAGDGGQC